MNSYQLTLLIKKDLEEKTRKELLEGVKKNLDKIEKEELWGNRSLAYPIKHESSAFYAYFEFALKPEKISGLDKNLKLNEDILRYLLIRR